MSAKRKEIHGNKAKAHPEHEIEPLNSASTVTVSYKKEHEVPVVNDSNVTYARNFVNENKK